MSEAPHVLIVDDDAGIRETMTDIMRLEGYQVTCAESGSRAVALCAEQHFHFALLDIRMPDMDGVETLRRIKEIDPAIRVIMITGYDVGTQAMQAMDEGAEAVFRKPLDVASFLPLLMESIEL